MLKMLAVGAQEVSLTAAWESVTGLQCVEVSHMCIRCCRLVFGGPEHLRVVEIGEERIVYRPMRVKWMTGFAVWDRSQGLSG